MLLTRHRTEFSAAAATAQLPTLGTGATASDTASLLRAMDALVDQQAAVDKVVARLLRPLLDQDLAVVFYDMTTIYHSGRKFRQLPFRSPCIKVLDQVPHTEMTLTGSIMSHY